MVRPVRFRFDDFVLAPRQRLLLREGTPVPPHSEVFRPARHARGAPARRGVEGRDSSPSVWRDVIVSDGALAQAVRTLRRTLGDNSREPKFIRTVSRHGYQFVYAGVVEEADEVPDPETGDAAASQPVAGRERTSTRLLDRLLADRAAIPARLDEARDLAERLHALGTGSAVAAIATPSRPLGGARAHAGHALECPRRRRRSARFRPQRSPSSGCACGMREASVARRWAAAALAGAIAGCARRRVRRCVVVPVAGLVGEPQRSRLRSPLSGRWPAVLARPASAQGWRPPRRSREAHRGLGLVLCGAVAGLFVAAGADLILRALVDGLVGHSRIDRQQPAGRTGDWRDGRAGLCAGDPPASGRRTRRARGTTTDGGGGDSGRIVVAAGAAALASAGGTLVGGVINDIAGSSPDAQLALAPLGRLIGEPDFGGASHGAPERVRRRRVRICPCLGPHGTASLCLTNQPMPHRLRSGPPLKISAGPYTRHPPARPVSIAPAREDIVTVRRLFAIVVIFLGASLALGHAGLVAARAGPEGSTRNSSRTSKPSGAGPTVRSRRSPSILRPGRPDRGRGDQARAAARRSAKQVTRAVVQEIPLPLERTRARVDLDLEQRRRGLLWYPDL